jgi:hypothetical protein
MWGEDIVCTISNNGFICHIDGPVWHLDVGSSHPGAGENIPSLFGGNVEVINKLKTVKAS